MTEKPRERPPGVRLRCFMSKRENTFDNRSLGLYNSCIQKRNIQMPYRYVSFDIADQTFKMYTGLDWHLLVMDAHKELQEDGYDTSSMELEELLERMYGDEFFWSEIV